VDARGLDDLPRLLAPSRANGFPTSSAGGKIWRPIEFLRQFNYIAHTEFPGVVTIGRGIHRLAAGDAAAVSRRAGLSFKWNMGWMHDTLDYLQRDSISGNTTKNDLTFATPLSTQRKFHPAALARRGRSRQGVADRADARRRLAEICKSPDAARVSMAVPRQGNCCSWAAKSASAPSGMKTPA